MHDAFSILTFKTTTVSDINGLLLHSVVVVVVHHGGHITVLVIRIIITFSLCQSELNMPSDRHYKFLVNFGIINYMSSFIVDILPYEEAIAS